MSPNRTSTAARKARVCPPHWALSVAGPMHNSPPTVEAMNTQPLPPLCALRRDRSPQAAAPRLPLELGPPTVALAPGELLCRSGVAGACLQVQAGRVWLTETDDAQDHFLAAGERHVVRGAGQVVVEALGPEVAVLTWLAR